MRGSAAYAVTQLNRKRSRTVNVASFFIDDTPFMVANNEERAEHEIALLHRSYIITMQEGKTGHEKRKNLFCRNVQFNVLGYVQNDGGIHITDDCKGDADVIVKPYQAIADRRILGDI